MRVLVRCTMGSRLGLGCIALVLAASSVGAEPATGTKGMVSSAHPRATRAGLNVLERGGNAFDAAIAIAATLNVTEPQNSGIGGYGLILIYDAEKKQIRALNSSGRIPLAVDSAAFRKSNPDWDANRRGAKAISTPTNLNAWAELSENYGVAPWRRLFDDAIAAAEGHLLSASTARAIKKDYDNFPDYAKGFYGANGVALGAGDILVQKDLANTLRMVADLGREALYGGPLGVDIIRTVEAGDGFLAMRDLKANEAEWWDPISVNYRGHEVYSAPPPANSFSSLLRLGMMERFDVAALGHNTPAFLHRFTEVTKHAFWARLRYAGDPGVLRPPVGMLLSGAYLDQQVARLDLEKATEFVPPGGLAKAGNDTTHFVVADADGNIVSATQTLGNGFGSRIMVEGRGLWLNNSLFYCTFEPEGNPMDAHPGRRKLISNHPTIILKDGRPVIAIGTPGGHTIGQTVPQMVMNLIDFEMDVQAAIDAPRVSFVEPNQLAVEESMPADVVNALEAMGHEIKRRSIGLAHGLTIEYDGKTSRRGRRSRSDKPTGFTGGADPRGSGVARGL